MVRSLIAAMMLIGLAYIIHLRRKLAIACHRGDMYRDIAAQLDRQRVSSPSVDTGRI